MLIAVITPHAATAESRVALVVGNSAYSHTTPLANPANDAVSVWRGGLLKDPGNAVLAETLERLQVTTIKMDLPQDSDLAADPLELDP